MTDVESLGWRATEWRQVQDLGPTHRPIGLTISLMTSPFYTGERYAVRSHFGQCLGLDGHWECESSPSARDDAFYARCRFPTFEAAAAAVAAADERLGIPATGPA